MNIYDRQGRPMRMEEYIEKHGDMVYRVVGRAQIDDECHVSTVWLGIDHNWGGGAPIIFETMIFGGPYDQAQWRYSTEEAAQNGHESVVLSLQLGTDPTEELAES